MQSTINDSLPMLFIAGRKSWEMPELTALNTLPPHALTIPFPAHGPIDPDPLASPWRQSLNGIWEFLLLPRPDQVTGAALASGEWKPIQVPGNWTMQGFGTPHYTNVQMPFPQMPPSVPDDNPTGVMLLTSNLEHLEWYGRGPWDNYSDRKASALIGRWRSTVTDQYVPYIMPQDHGHKTDVRFLTLTDQDRRGLFIGGQPTFEFSALHHSDDDLFRALHTIDLTPRAEVFLNLDAVHRGLGTLSCGPDTLEQYRLMDSAYRFGYRMRVVSSDVG